MRDCRPTENCQLSMRRISAIQSGWRWNRRGDGDQVKILQTLEYTNVVNGVRFNLLGILFGVKLNVINSLFAIWRIVETESANLRTVA